MAHTSTAGGIDALMAILAVCQSSVCWTNTDLSCSRLVVSDLWTVAPDLDLDNPRDIDDDASAIDAFRLSGRMTGDLGSMVTLGLLEGRAQSQTPSGAVVYRPLPYPRYEWRWCESCLLFLKQQDTGPDYLLR
jgi:hypothetical protein